MDFEFLDQLKGKWEPVSRPALIGWLVFYGLFLIYASRANDGLIIDNVNLIDADSDGYDHAGEPTTLWGYLRVGLDRGGPGEDDKGEDIDLNGFGPRIWGETR